MILMTTDMRKWINLMEDDDEWISNEDIKWMYIEDRYHDEWDELTGRIDKRYHQRALYKLQDVFQKWIKPWKKPAWISDIEIRRVDTAWVTMHWKVETEDDPDEY